ncbi:DUF4199 domain-containing protein [Pedobacter montanisoli]|uniref:DUF4199 domain-containing protein n=1 Tax=Pedobacter montanisoli TaxID=2923277 RepID=A0ABS9ZZS7_9SPHI|nr:DUF4199 domain-containing protein [Pedobacter montanisoli]MCJ0743831.1 DUF4199 domain-containing protein [Pedobacter montanisoli]
MVNNQPGVNLKSEALKNGLIWGIINIVIFLISWYVMPSIMGSYTYGILTMLIGIALAIFFCLDMRKKAGGYWTFSQALGPIFVTFLLSMAIMYIFNIAFGKYIDPSYPTTMKEMVLSKSESTMKSLGLSDEDTAKALESTEKSLDKQFSPSFGQAIVGFGISAVMYFIGALIFALIFKKSDPNPFANVINEQPSEQ